MTLGELKDQGKVPSSDQIWALEMEASKECTRFGIGYPHLFHCTPYGRDKVMRTLCHEVDRLHRALRKMFPGIELIEH